MRYLSLLSLIAVIALSGCTTVPPSQPTPLPPEPSRPVIEVQADNQEYLEQIASVAREMRGICAASDFQSYFKKSPCLPSGITETHLKDKSRITKEQKKATARLFARQHELNADFQSYFKKSPCLPSGITETHLKDKSRITKEQKKATARLFARQHELNAKTRAIMMESLDPEMMRMAQQSETRVMPRVDELQQALLSGRITWGEYNRTRLAIFENNR